MTADLVAAAASKLGIPEPLVKRSAEARAKATGVPVEDVLRAWAGGESTPAPTATPPAPEAPQPETPEPPATQQPPQPQPQPTPTQTPASPPTPQPVAAPPTPEPGIPPVLEGRVDRPFLVLAGAVAVFLLTVLAGFAVPAAPTNDNPVYSSAYPYSESALRGRQVYLSQGCAACHTQLVRPVVADADLGPVTLADTNQVLGQRRLGPDLSHIGGRVDSEEEIVARLRSGTDHPDYSFLDPQDLADLVAYLMESK